MMPIPAKSMGSAHCLPFQVTAGFEESMTFDITGSFDRSRTYPFWAYSNTREYDCICRISGRVPAAARADIVASASLGTMSRLIVMPGFSAVKASVSDFSPAWISCL